MMKRKGADAGHGSGYRNLGNYPKDPQVHRQSAKGMKQPQNMPASVFTKQKPYDNKYLVAVKMSSGNMVFDFKTLAGRNKFIKSVKERGLEYATSELPANMEHHKDMPVQEIDSMLIGFDHSESPNQNVSYPSLATDMPPPPQPPKESLFTRAGRGALELAKKSKQYGADYLAKQKELSQLKKQAEIETIEHPAVQDLKKQRERVTELEYQVATTEDPDKVNRLETELEAERTQLREKQEVVTNIKVEDLSDVELKLLAVRHVQGTGFFSGMFGQSNPYKAELLRRIAFKRQLERDMTQIEKQQDALDKAAKEGKKEGSGGFFDFLP